MIFSSLRAHSSVRDDGVDRPDEERRKARPRHAGAAHPAHFLRKFQVDPCGRALAYRLYCWILAGFRRENKINKCMPSGGKWKGWRVWGASLQARRLAWQPQAIDLRDLWCLASLVRVMHALVAPQRLTFSRGLARITTAAVFIVSRRPPSSALSRRRATERARAALGQCRPRLQRCSGARTKGENHRVGAPPPLPSPRPPFRHVLATHGGENQVGAANVPCATAASSHEKRQLSRQQCVKFCSYFTSIVCAVETHKI